MLAQEALFTSPLVRVRSIAVSVSVCPSLCLCACMSQKRQVQTLINFLYMLPVAEPWLDSSLTTVQYVMYFRF